MVIIRVINQSTGRPVSGAKVTASFNFLTRMGNTSGQTDSSGVAHLNTDPASSGEIYINGRSVYKGRVTADMSFSV